MVNIKIGCDPELFAYDKETGEARSVHDLIPGDKLEPMKVPRGAIQVDGVAAEFNIVPAESKSAFIKSIDTVQRLLSSILDKQSNGKLEFRINPTATFSEEYFATVPFQSKLLGCEPDYNAYTGKVNPRPNGDRPFRTAAGHIHVGWTEGVENPFEGEHFETCRELTKYLDFVLFKSSSYWDKDETRRTLYGAPGAFRPKPYGLEYRTLSNKWLSSRALQRFVYDGAKATAVKYFNNWPISEGYSEKGFEEYLAFLEARKFPNVVKYTATAA